MRLDSQHSQYGTIGIHLQACYALQRKSHLCIPFLGIARPQSHFSHSCACGRFIIPRSGPHIFLQHKRQIDRGNIYIAHRHSINVEIGALATQFLFWEYLLRIFGIGSLQCAACYQSSQVSGLVGSKVYVCFSGEYTPVHNQYMRGFT
jgi:hypothetical protein